MLILESEYMKEYILSINETKKYLNMNKIVLIGRGGVDQNDIVSFVKIEAKNCINIILNSYKIIKISDELINKIQVYTKDGSYIILLKNC